MSIIREIAVFLCGFIMMRSSDAQILTLGQCPEFQAMTDFNLTRYLGRWYEAEKYFFLFEVGGKCITADYAPKEDDKNAITVVNKQINIYTGLASEIRGVATVDGAPDVARLLVRFPSLKFDIRAPYWVLDTDYDNYAVVWSCYSLGDFDIFGKIHTKNAWILTRKPNPTQSVMMKAYEVVDKFGISKGLLLPTNQRDCPKD